MSVAAIDIVFEPCQGWVDVNVFGFCQGLYTTVIGYVEGDIVKACIMVVMYDGGFGCAGVAIAKYPKPVIYGG